MFNKQFLEDFYNGNYCPSDNAGSTSFKSRNLSHKIDTLEKQLYNKLDKKSRKLFTQLIEYKSEELNEFAFRAYFDGINFATTILMNSIDDGEN
ncbi:MAG: hypothetical protein Q4C11_00185 [Clostridium sp.]|nr:hypothetical protein [Clostridium sp.]